jgi:hypothetical protein
MYHPIVSEHRYWVVFENRLEHHSFGDGIPHSLALESV